MNTSENPTYKKNAWLALTLALVCISFAAVAMGLNDLSQRKHPNGQLATITVSGEGESTAIPDIATVTLTARESAKTVPEAQKLVETKITKALSEITALGVDKKDTKTISYTVNPKYESQSTYCLAGYINCPTVKSVVVGYEVSETLSVKVRKLDKAGDVISVIGKANITEVSGPDFAVDNMDVVNAEAKARAIEKAKNKAKETAKSLGVTLGEITQFSEDNGGYYPTMYKAVSMDASVASGRESVTVPAGESVVKSRVTLTYTLE